MQHIISVANVICPACFRVSSPTSCFSVSGTGLGTGAFGANKATSFGTGTFSGGTTGFNTGATQGTGGGLFGGQQNKPTLTGGLGTGFGGTTGMLPSLCRQIENYYRVSYFLLKKKYFNLHYVWEWNVERIYNLKIYFGTFPS